MIPGIQKLRYADHDEWLEIRKKSIGGSDAAAIMGLSQYGSAHTLWAEKSGKVIPPDISDVEAVRLGRDLEDYVAHRFMEATGKKVRRENSIMKNPAYPFAHASVDRMVIGEDAGLECKTTSVLNMKKFKGGEYPVNYYTQCQHYMMVTGAEKWYLAVLILGVEFKWFEIPRNEEDIEALASAEEVFWQCVQDGTPPPVSGLDCDDETLKAMYPESHGGCIDLWGREYMIDEYKMIGERIKELERHQNVIRQQICADMGDYESATAGKYKIKWKTQTRNTFDSKRFIADHPGMNFSDYYKQSNARPFRID